MSRQLAGLVLFALGSLGGAAAHAQPEAAVPTAARHQVLDVNRLAAVVPAKLDLVKIAEEDAARDAAGLPPRFAVPERVSLTPATHGTWEPVGKAQLLWRLRIVGAAGTNSLNLGFTRFKMPARGRLLLYATDGTQVTRAFTAADNEEHGELWTPAVVTSDLIVELTVPRKLAHEVALELGWINQGYRGFGTISSTEKSGSCNMDVECLAVGDTWRDEMRAVGVISTGGTTFCTGSLVNNTAGDRKMYFATAAHCSINTGNAASLVVYWNYQNSFCRAPGSAQSGQPGDGALTQFHTGSFHRATNTPSDFTLVELDDPAVAAYNHHWAGWDRSTGSFTCTAAAPCSSIHHPSTDEKRITYVVSDLIPTSYNNPSSPGDGSHLWARWATDPPGPVTIPGVTEPGSSGSPLYNAAGRFVGQLHGGPSSCGATGNNLSDYYGRFSLSWTGGGTNSTRASNWLDPGATGATTTSGIDQGTGPCTPPPAPTGLSASAVSPTQINLSWSAASGATSYGIARATTSGGPYSSAGTSATTSFSNTGLACNTTYYFVVTSSNGSCSSGNSTQVSAATQACPPGNVLQNGVPVTGLSGAASSQQLWTMTVPAGATNLQFQTSGGSGDADLYVRFGAAPTLTTYDCRPYSGGNNETCPFPTPAAGTWHVMLNGYSAYSGLTLVGSYQTAPICNAISDVEPNDSTATPQIISGTCNQISGTFLNDATTQQNDYFRLSLPAGRTVTALLNGLSVDYDLYIYNAAGTQVASSTAGGTTADQATWTNTGGSAVNVFVRVLRYSSTRTTYQLRVSY